MRITVVGVGYVGLVAGTCFAETGNDVILIDVDQEKIKKLQKGIVPFYEPGLQDLLHRNLRQERLTFSTDLKSAIARTQVAFITVGTPESKDGSADLRYVLEVAGAIGSAMTGQLIVVNKSTVPVGTAQKVTEVIQSRTQHRVSVVSNPEFLKEGAAVEDFMRPDRVVIGTEDPEARKIMADLYAPFVRTNNPILFMDNLSAEMAKYTANCILASRISFMNEIANLCDAVGADVDQVRIAIGNDRRIGHSFLFPGVGYGGSCFPKDVRALLKTGLEYGLPMKSIAVTDEINEAQKHRMASLVERVLGKDLRGKLFALWGLSYKPRTDDLREAPALVVIEDLIQAGAKIQAFDPEAMEGAKRLLGDRIVFCKNNYDCCQDADALIISTEWNEFRRPDFDRIRELLNKPLVFDGRNIYDPERMIELGFEYYSIGRNKKSKSINCRHRI